MSDEAEMGSHAPAFPRGVEPEEGEPAGSGMGGRGEDAKQRGLAGPVVAKHGKVLSLIQDKVHCIQGQVGPEALCELVRDDRAHLTSGL